MSDIPRYIGLDIGERRIGIAISDPLGITAAGLETIERRNIKADVSVIRQICKRHGAMQIVIGLPLNMDGSDGMNCEKIRSFGQKLARETGLPIVYEDERLSTITAIRMLTVQGVKTGKRRDLVDMQAAAVILQKFLDNQSPPQPA